MTRNSTPLQLLDDVERDLGLQCYPITWPIHSGDRFLGVYNRVEKRIHLFERGVLVTGLTDPVVPRGDEEIRAQVNADHTEADIDEVLAHLAAFA